jgi:zinc transporter ZupT
MNPLIFSCVAFLSTLTGGFLALRFSRSLHLILSFTAGVLLGVVAFDLLPEIFVQSAVHHVDPLRSMVALVAGFLIFHAIEKFVAVHPLPGEDCAHHHHPQRGVFSALALSGHSFMDGIGIGLAFQASPAVGLTVALAVIAHDFCDGLNTAGLMLAHRNTRTRTLKLLLLDAVAPVLGAASTLIFQAPPDIMTIYLGFFAGFLLYIGAADVLPEAHSRKGATHPAGLVLITCLGAAFMYEALAFL